MRRKLRIKKSVSEITPSTPLRVKKAFMPSEVEALHRTPYGGAKSRYAGLTITEVVMASALLIFAMVPILKGLTSAHVGTMIIERKSRSLILAQAKLDEIKARSVFHYSETFTQTNVPLDGSYLCNVEDSSINSDLRKMTVSVGYDLNGDNILDPDESEVTLATCIAKR